MPRPPHRPPRLCGRVFRGRQAVTAGLLTRRQLDCPAWRRLLRDVYADCALPVTHGLYVAAARLVIPRDAVLAGRSAAWQYGATDLVGAHDPVEVLVPRSARFGPVAGLRIRTVTDLPAAAVRTWDGPRITTPARTAADVARWSPDLVEAVTRLDHLLAAGALRLPRLPEVRGWLSAGPGSALGRRALQLADGRAESAPESRLRVRLVLAGLPAPEPQYEVRHEGRFLARVDLAYPEQKLAIEYDGAWHAESGQFGRDRQRLNRLVAAGWRVIHVTAANMHHPGAVITAIRAALYS